MVRGFLGWSYAILADRFVESKGKRNDPLSKKGKGKEKENRKLSRKDRSYRERKHRPLKRQRGFSCSR